MRLVRRAKQILLVVGICVTAIGLEALAFPQTNPEALTQSLFVRLAAAGAFTRPGLILICVGLACLAVATLLPARRE
jgi:hypothetical protein